jgi:adenylosuccinate synthase
MPLDLIIGAQWGDEGKGRITDRLSAQADVVVRFSGGDNAGHTVAIADQIHKLHLIPSGILQDHTRCAMAAGMVINPARLIGELDHLLDIGVDVSPERLKIAYQAHIITPAHILLDGAEEDSEEHKPIGTTRRGIGPAYTDKASRRGIRAEHMEDINTFRAILTEHLHSTGRALRQIYDIEPPRESEIIDRYIDFAKRLQPYLADVSRLIHDELNQGNTVLGEGAQGTLLDLDFGTYPFVTSSHPTAAGALQGLGAAPKHLRRVIGVVKAFQTRVGEGPFPTEEFGDTAERLRGTGEQPWDEFGTTTGRPRRCGWMDGVLLRYADRLNGFTELALTKLDILSGLDPVKICTAYQLEEKEQEDLQFAPSNLDRCTPIYTSLAGWQQDISTISVYNNLPEAAREFVETLETAVGVSVGMISVGPERDQIIFR